MRLRPFWMDDVAWASPLAERMLTHLDVGYGSAVTKWAAAPSVHGHVIDDDVPMGFVLVGTFGLLGQGRVRVLEILALLVHPAFRKRGVGRSLLARALQDARVDPAVREVRLEVATDNLPARHLFAQAGFVVDREDNGTFPGGQQAMRLRWRRREQAPAWNL